MTSLIEKLFGYKIKIHKLQSNFDKGLSALSNDLGGSPGLVVMGGNSWVEGLNAGAVNWMDIKNFTYICCKNYNVCLKDQNK